MEHEFISAIHLESLGTELVSDFILLCFLETLTPNEPLMTNKTDARTNPAAKGAFSEIQPENNRETGTAPKDARATILIVLPSLFMGTLACIWEVMITPDIPFNIPTIHKASNTTHSEGMAIKNKITP